MFNQAESVFINGKEVESIITADEGALYQKNPGYELALSCDKPILSFNDNDSCTITGVLTKDGTLMDGEAIDYQIVHNDTVLEVGTLITDALGEIALNYESAGVGDVDVVFSLRSLLQKTFVVEDCWNTQISEITIGSSQVVSSIGMDTVHNVQNDDFCLIFDHEGNGTLNIGATSQYSTPSTANYRLTLGTYNNKHYLSVRTNSTDELSGSSANFSTYYTYKIEKQGTTVKFYIDDVLWQTKTVTFFSDYSAWSIYNIKWSSGTDYMKNIRLKAL